MEIIDIANFKIMDFNDLFMWCAEVNTLLIIEFLLIPVTILSIICLFIFNKISFKKTKHFYSIDNSIITIYNKDYIEGKCKKNSKNKITEIISPNEYKIFGILSFLFLAVSIYASYKQGLLFGNNVYIYGTFIAYSILYLCIFLIYLSQKISMNLNLKEYIKKEKICDKI